MLSPAASDTRLHPLEALAAIRRLLNDPNDTRQVFIVLQAMRGRSGLRLFRRFQATITGAAILRERRSLLPCLQDSLSLARLPHGSLGQAYLDFISVEKLTADGLVDASDSAERSATPDEILLFRDRIRDIHDLTHVITGYGRDPLGELCLLAFNHAQNGHLGVAMIVLMGMVRVGRGPRAGDARAAIIEAWRRGRAAAWLSGLDWEALLPQSVAILRDRLGIAEPRNYRAAA
jgi:ubiquinone biosynthesis protein COQ4